MTHDLSDWLPPALVGVCFTGLALLKFYGMSRGIVGGRAALAAAMPRQLSDLEP